MGNLESADGGPGEPPSVSLLPPPGKMPMPEPCELEERFALVLVREPRPFPLLPPPRSQRRGGIWPRFPRWPTLSARASDRPCPPAPSWKPLSSAVRLARQPLGTEVSATGHLGGESPARDRPRLRTSSSCPLPPTPLRLPFSLLPTSPTGSPGP